MRKVAAESQGGIVKTLNLRRQLSVYKSLIMGEKNKPLFDKVNENWVFSLGSKSIFINTNMIYGKIGI